MFQVSKTFFCVFKTFYFWAEIKFQNNLLLIMKKFRLAEHMAS